MLGVSIAAVADLHAVGAAVLGLWCVFRFPGRGPQSLRSAMLLVLVAGLVLAAAGVLTRVAVAIGGTPFALLCVLLPILTLAFWTGGHLVRLWVVRGLPNRR